MLFAFTLQSYATQIHIHGPSHAIDRISIAKVSGKTGTHGESPSAPDTNDCPICQAIAHNGVFFAPVAPLLLLPAWVAQVSPPVSLRTVAGPAAPHDWFSRAPPQN